MLYCMYRDQDVSPSYMDRFIIVFPRHTGGEARKVPEILHV